MSNDELRIVSKELADAPSAAATQARASFEAAYARLSEHLKRVDVSPLGHATQALQETFKRMAAIAEQLPGEMRRALRVLGERGWYVEMDMPVTLPPQLADWVENDLSAAAEWLVGYYRKRTAAIIEETATRFPRRRRALQLALDAHARAEYELSVPIFLIQADGVCHELIGTQLYRRERHGPPATSRYVESLPADRLLRALLEPLTVVLPIAASFDPPWTGEHLNRHAVVHGTATDYGTEVNSLKAISLLAYVASVLREESAAS